MRLAGIASSVWPHIEAEYYQIDLFSLSPAKMLNLVFAWYVQRIPEDKLDEAVDALDDLLPWETTSSAAAEELESASFMAMMAKGD